MSVINYKNIKLDTIEKVIYNLCLKGNVCLNKTSYCKILSAYKKAKDKTQKEILSDILKNAKLAHDLKRPLCQDTGQVLVFLEIGQEVLITGGDLKEGINRAVEKCYRENCFRKSVVKNALFERTNTTSNTPAIIYTDIVKGDKVRIDVLIKGAGSENKSCAVMELPSLCREELKEEIVNLILSSGVNACPPLFIGIGLGQTLEGAAVLSKKALFRNEMSKEEQDFSEEIKKGLNDKAPKGYKGIYALGVKMFSSSTHIASMPLGISINCHSLRELGCTIDENGITYDETIDNFEEIKETEVRGKEVFTNDSSTVRSLKEGERVFLTGEIYVARDAAHKKMAELMKENKPLPIKIKDKIILYAGPCPAKQGEIIGPVGPTTSGRMDRYSFDLYDKGLTGTIGKGQRSLALTECIRKNKGIYFSMQGGVASLIQQCVKSAEIIAFPELGAEAIYKLYVERMPVKVEISGFKE